jgi:subfamily B ATP-binding cassette protein MsbA
MTMSAGEFLAYFTALAMLVKPIKGLVGFNKPIQKAIIAGQSVFDLIDHKSETNNGKTVKDNIKGDIEFNNVSFAYEKDKTVLKNFSLKINHGESVAIVGSTGSGKSTIVDLIARFYLPISGEIKIDNKNINEYELNNLRSFISYVDQSALLFNTSIRENISIGASNISDKELKDYANASCAYEFINKLDQKFDFEIGENGAKLSGGQKQRLALARAFAKNAPIFIFDEATSALDANTEKEVQRNISNLSDNRTSIIIAHRLSTIKNADRIVFLKDGLITEIGTH